MHFKHQRVLQDWHVDNDPKVKKSTIISSLWAVSDCVLYAIYIYLSSSCFRVDAIAEEIAIVGRIAYLSCEISFIITYINFGWLWGSTTRFMKPSLIQDDELLVQINCCHSGNHFLVSFLEWTFKQCCGHRPIDTWSTMQKNYSTQCIHTRQLLATSTHHSHTQQFILVRRDEAWSCKN